MPAVLAVLAVGLAFVPAQPASASVCDPWAAMYDNGGLFKWLVSAFCDRHHMVASRAHPPGFNPNCAPAIRMDPADHRLTSSNGNNGNDGIKYRQDQMDLIKQGKYNEAFEMDIADLKNIRSLDGTGRTLYDKYRAQIDAAIAAYNKIKGQENNLDDKCKPYNEPNPALALREVRSATHDWPAVVSVTTERNPAGTIYVDVTDFTTVTVPQGVGSYTGYAESYFYHPDDQPTTAYAVQAGLKYVFYEHGDEEASWMGDVKTILYGPKSASLTVYSYCPSDYGPDSNL